VTARKTRSIDLATATIHAGTEARGADTPVVHPIYQSVNFIQEIGTAEGLRYPRYGNSPNAELVQRRVAALEGAEAAVLLGSGMGAIACGLLALLRPGDHLVASSTIYGGATELLTKEFATLGIEVSLVDPFEPRVWRRMLRTQTRAVVSRDTGESDVSRDRSSPDQLRHARTRHRARRRLDVRRARSTCGRSNTGPTSSSTRRQNI
jgi:Cystathionine beta-lyases/cystathionine gamma-synthases